MGKKGWCLEERERGVETSSISLAPRQEVVNAKFAQDLIHYIFNQTDVSFSNFNKS